MAPLIAQTIPYENIDDIVDTTEITPWDPVWAIITLVAGYIIARLTRRAVRRYGAQANLPPNLLDLASTIVMWTVMTLAVVIALTFLGLTIAPVWLVILLIIIVFAVGGRALMEAFGAGVLLQARAPFEPGDLVQLREEKGIVVETNSRVVVLDTADGRRLYIPNQQVISEPIVNLTHRRVRMSAVYLDVEYGTDLEAARRVAVDSLADLESVRTKPKPVAEITSFEESSVRIRLRFWHKSDLLSEWTAVDNAARAAYSAFYDNGIVFAFPQETLWWGKDQKPGPEAP